MYTLTHPQVGAARLMKEKCFCVTKHSERACGCGIHVQLSYFLESLRLWRKAEHARRPGRQDCECECICCRNSHEIGRSQLRDCSAFSAAIHHSEYCSKRGEANCRPLRYVTIFLLSTLYIICIAHTHNPRCGLGLCDHCANYDDALHVCPNDYSSNRLVRYKTLEPVSSGGKVFDDWIYKELKIKPFLLLLKTFFTEKYR